MSKKRNRIATAALFASASLLCTNSAYAGNLRTGRIFVGRTFVCNNTLQTVQWQNTTGSTLFVKNVSLGQGGTYRQNFDTYKYTVEVKRVSDNTIIGYERGDIALQYFEFVGPWPTDHFVLANGDKLQLSVTCGPSGNLLINGLLQYTLGAP